LAGARVDRIAKLSGVNKRMLYHYFESKEELFREMLRRNIVQLSNAEAVTPPNLGEALGYWQELMIGNSD
jgi:AcrR family transcriptional regulator